MAFASDRLVRSQPSVTDMKMSMSRFQIHDELTAPERSAPVLRGALSGGGQLPNFLGVLAGSPAALLGHRAKTSERSRTAEEETS